MAGCFLLAMTAVAAAVTGPLYVNAATNSLLADRVAASAQWQTGLGYRFQPAVGSSVVQALRDARAIGAHISDRGFAPPQLSLVTRRVKQPDREVQLFARGDACAHMRITGRCPTAPGEMLVSSSDIHLGGFHLGQQVTVLGLAARPLSLRVVGFYRLRNVAGAYWYDPTRFITLPANPNARPEPTAYQPAPFFVAPTEFDRLAGQTWTVLVDRPVTHLDRLDPPALTALGALAHRETRRAALRYHGGSLSAALDNQLSSIAVEIAAENKVASATVLPAVASLAAVAVLLLYGLLAVAADQRRTDVALVKLRGLSGPRLWLFTLGEAGLVLVAAGVAGTLLGFFATTRLAAAWLRPGIAVHMVSTATIEAAVVVLVGFASLGLATRRVLREPLHDQLSDVARPIRSSRLSYVLRAVVVAVTGVAVAGLATSRSGSVPNLLDLSTPFLLAVVLGWLAAAALVWSARSLTRRTRRRRALGLFLGVRTLSRRQVGAVLVLPVTAALAIGVFAGQTWESSVRWRESAAAAQVGAAVSYPTGLQPLAAEALTHRLDPQGRYLMTAAVLDRPPLLPTVYVDASRLGTVADWPSSWTPGSSVASLGRQLSGSGSPLVLHDGVLSLSVDDELNARGVTVWIEALTPDGSSQPVILGGGPASGPARLTGRLTGCATGCVLNSVQVLSGGSELSAKGAMTFRSLRLDGKPVDMRFGSASAWRPGRPFADTGSVVQIAGAGSAGLRVTVDTGGTAQPISITPTDVPDQRPVVVGSTSQLTQAPFTGGRGVQVPRLDGVIVPGRPIAVASGLPLVGPRGVMGDLQVFAREGYASGVYPVVHILTTSGTPASLVTALSRNGVDTRTPVLLSSVRARLDGDAYAVSLRVYLAVAVAILLLVLGGGIANIAVQIRSRRVDAAALTVVGVRRRVLWRAAAAEFLGVFGAASLAGLVAGAAAQQLVVRSLRLGDVTTSTPPVPTSLDLPLLVTSVGAVVIALLLISSAAGALIIRGAHGADLRATGR